MPPPLNNEPFLYNKGTVLHCIYHNTVRTLNGQISQSPVTSGELVMQDMLDEHFDSDMAVISFKSVLFTFSPIAFCQTANILHLD